MSQHDYIIDNQSAPAARADINAVLQAIATTNSGATAPVNTFANMLWYDTATNQLKKRNEADSAWLILGTIDDTGGTFTPNSLLTTAGIAPATLVTNAEGVGNNYNNTTIPTSAAVYDIAASLASSAAGGVVSATTANVLNATAGASTGAVGTYAFLKSSSNGVGYTPGTLYAGFSYTGYKTPTFASTGTGAPAGTWRAMGYTTTVVGEASTTLFLRVA